MKPFLFIAVVATVLPTINACYKAEHTCANKYDLCYDGQRDYSLTFDQIDVVMEEATDNVNGLLDPEEIAYLNVYLKNNGPDPCMLTEGTFEEAETVNGFYIYNADIGINDGGLRFTESSEELGYDVQYIDPGQVDFLQVKVRTYPSITPDQDVPLLFTLKDDDGQSHTVNFSIHVQ